MQRVVTVRGCLGKQRINAFTLVELIVVMTIILILVGLTIQAASGVLQASARGRCRSEIQGLTTALESYKNDNGAYPASSTLLTNSAASPYGSAVTGTDGSGSTYQGAAQVLYEALSGKINYQDTTLTATALTGAKVAYMTFKVSQLGGNMTTISGGTVAANSTYVQDPWSYAYGYSTGTSSSYPYTGTGFFDLWSTAGVLAPAATNSAAWIANWQQ